MILWITVVVLCLASPVLILLRYFWNVRVFRLSEERINRMKDNCKLQGILTKEEIRQLQMKGRGIRKT